MSGLPTIVSQLAYEDLEAALAWLERAFGFRERRVERFTDEHGRVLHSQMEYADGAFLLGGDGGHGAKSPRNLGGFNQFLTVYADDLDAHVERARAGGATIHNEPETRHYGRVYEASDLEGHRWRFIQRTA